MAAARSVLHRSGLGEHGRMVQEKHKMSFFGVFPGVSCQAYIQACWRREGLSVPGCFFARICAQSTATAKILSNRET